MCAHCSAHKSYFLTEEIEDDAPEGETFVIGGATVWTLGRMIPKTLLSHPLIRSAWSVAYDVLVFRSALFALQSEFFAVDDHINYHLLANIGKNLK